MADSGVSGFGKNIKLLKKRDLKRNAIAISRFFYNISDLWANEIFGVVPFIMLKIVAGKSPYD